jgi:myo-inositol-1(or 4)-monophosphatase
MEHELQVAIAAAQAGGEIVAAHFGRELEVEEKGENHPVTTADRESDRAIRALCAAEFPEDGWLSEESEDSPARRRQRRVWVVDPLDGTREFLNRIPEFCVCVALVVEGVVQVGVSYNPVAGELFAARRGGGTTLNGEPVLVRDAAELAAAKVFASRSEYARGEWAPFEGIMDVTPLGSVAYKLAAVAAGRAAATFTLRPKSEWDVCSGVLLVEEAGGVVTLCDGRPLTFNTESAELPNLVAAAPSTYGPLCDVIRARPAG